MESQVTPTPVQQRALAFVRALELPETSAPTLKLDVAEAAPSDNEEEGFVDSGAVMSFVSGLSVTHKSDVLNSTLLAQLAANKKYNREDYPVEWYAFYRDVLENVGWTISAWNFTKYTTSGSTLTIEQTVLELLAAIATENYVAIAAAALEALKKSGDSSNPFKIWDQNTHNASSGNFQIGACAEDDGNVAMNLGAFYFSSQQVTSQFLWISYSSSDIELYQGGQTVVLNEETYEFVRKDIIQKLGQNAKDFIADLEI